MKDTNREAVAEGSSCEEVQTSPGPLAQLMMLPRDGRAPRTVEHALPSGRRVEVGLDAETVRIVSAEGRVELTVKCTEAGCVLQFETANLSLQNQGKINLQCEELNVETSKQLSLHSQGSVTTHAASIRTRADEIHMQATVGDAVVQANDFVRMNGEQILLNSDDDPREREKQLHDLWSKLTNGSD